MNKGKFINQYYSQNGNQVFVYGIEFGTDAPGKAALKAYKEAQGDNYREDKDTKQPLLFSPRFLGKSPVFEQNKETGKLYQQKTEEQMQKEQDRKDFINEMFGTKKQRMEYLAGMFGGAA